MRTAGEMGFEVESSYINLAVESGIFLAALILVTFLSVLVNCYRKQASGSAFYRFAFYTLLFALFQSIFNRYLIAIGNPFSLFILVILSKASPRYRMSGGAPNVFLRHTTKDRRGEGLPLPPVRTSN
jgi:hypothetical protein